RRNWLFRPMKTFRRSSGDILELIGASAPAEKIGGAPVTMTTRVAASSRNSANAMPSSVSIGSLSELRRSGRFRVTVAIAPSRSIVTFSMSADRTTRPVGTANERRRRSAQLEEVHHGDADGRQGEQRADAGPNES